MENERKQKAYKLGLLISLWALQLSLYADFSNHIKLEDINETRKMILIYLDTFGIKFNIKIPNRKEINNYLADEYPKLIMNIGKRISIIQNSEITSIYFLTTEASGYLQALNGNLSNMDNQIEKLKSGIQYEAEKLKINQKTLKKFFINPDKEWDSLFQSIEENGTNENLISAIEAKPNWFGFGVDLKKLLSLTSKRYEKKK